MNIGLKDEIIGLKSKLENLERDFEEKLKDVEHKEKKFRKLEDQVNEIIENKDTIMKLNIGGKIFQAKISTLLHIKDTLFYKLVCTNIDSNTEIKRDIFIDRSYEHFNMLLDYLRTGKYCLDGFTAFEIDDIKKEAEYYGLSEISEYIETKMKEIEFVRLEAAPQYSTAGTYKLEDLKDKSMMKGICVQSPYHIIIELNSVHPIDEIEIGGYNGNPGIWYVGNGSGARILTSVNKNEWKDVGVIPSFGASIVNVKLTPSEGKFIKFQHTSYLGIGYLNIINSYKKIQK
jgi:hypothetical protein